METDTRSERLEGLALQGIIVTPIAAEDLKGIWTRFQDTLSGGVQQEPWKEILIQAPLQEARKVFRAIFGHSPYRKERDGRMPPYGAFEVNKPEDYAAAIVRGQILCVKASDILPEWRH